MHPLPFHEYLLLLAQHKNLSRDQATRAFQIIMNGGATPAQIAALLMGLRMKGETVEEIAAGAIVLRAKAPAVHAPEGVMDCCGTGGDAKGTYNISTAVAFVLAACGVPVAKHGNHSVSSQSGSADVLAALGVKIDAPIPVIQQCFNKAGIAFLMAPKFHAAMRHVAPIRQELGLRTIFNLLGPLANPAAPKRQLVGVYEAAWAEPIAQVLKALGTTDAWVVHGSDGLDELTLSGASHVAQLKNGEVTCFDITPEEAGLAAAPLDELRGGDAAHNAAALMHALSGAESAHRRAVIFNAAAGLIVAGQAADIKEGVVLAAQAIDSGRAYETLKKLVEVSHNRA